MSQHKKNHHIGNHYSKACWKKVCWICESHPKYILIDTDWKKKKRFYLQQSKIFTYNSGLKIAVKSMSVSEFQLE